MFSLVNVSKEANGLVDGYWIQDHTGNLETAILIAKETEKANGNKITVAVVYKVNGSGPRYHSLHQLERLDLKRTTIISKSERCCNCPCASALEITAEDCEWCAKDGMTKDLLKDYRKA